MAAIKPFTMVHVNKVYNLVKNLNKDTKMNNLEMSDAQVSSMIRTFNVLKPITARYLLCSMIIDYNAHTVERILKNMDKNLYFAIVGIS